MAQGAHLRTGKRFDQSQGMSELQLENSRLRRLVTNLLLEKMKREEDSFRGER
jgi:hypothetical protein